MNFAGYQGAELRGGFIIVSVAISADPLIDAAGRSALAQTRIVGRRFEILLTRGMSEEEISISLYHEVLEAATVAVMRAPSAVLEFNEAAFEAAARQMHRRFGFATLANLDEMLAVFGFSDEN